MFGAQYDIPNALAIDLAESRSPLEIGKTESNYVPSFSYTHRSAEATSREYARLRNFSERLARLDAVLGFAIMVRLLVFDDCWKLIEPLLPREPPKPKGGSNRDALTGIIFILASDILWELMPQELGCGSGAT